MHCLILEFEYAASCRTSVCGCGCMQYTGNDTNITPGLAKNSSYIDPNYAAANQTITTSLQRGQPLQGWYATWILRAGFIWFLQGLRPDIPVSAYLLDRGWYVRCCTQLASSLCSSHQACKPLNTHSCCKLASAISVQCKLAKALPTVPVHELVCTAWLYVSGQ